MSNVLIVCAVFLLTLASFGQGKRLWVLRSPGEMAEYDPATFAAKQAVKVPAEAVQSPENISVNRLGQILFETPVSLPLSEDDAKSAHKVWFWNGHNCDDDRSGVEAGGDRRGIESGGHGGVSGGISFSGRRASVLVCQ